MHVLLPWIDLLLHGLTCFHWLTNLQNRNPVNKSNPWTWSSNRKKITNACLVDVWRVHAVYILTWITGQYSCHHMLHFSALFCCSFLSTHMQFFPLLYFCSVCCLVPTQKSHYKLTWIRFCFNHAVNEKLTTHILVNALVVPSQTEWMSIPSRCCANQNVDWDSSLPDRYSVHTSVLNGVCTVVSIKDSAGDWNFFEWMCVLHQGWLAQGILIESKRSTRHSMKELW